MNENNKQTINKPQKYKVGDIVRISKFKNVCSKGYKQRRYITRSPLIQPIVKWGNIFNRRGKAHISNYIYFKRCEGGFYEFELQKTERVFI